MEEAYNRRTVMHSWGVIRKAVQHLFSEIVQIWMVVCMWLQSDTNYYCTISLVFTCKTVHPTTGFEVPTTRGLRQIIIKVRDEKIRVRVSCLKIISFPSCASIRQIRAGLQHSWWGPGEPTKNRWKSRLGPFQRRDILNQRWTDTHYWENT